VWASWACFEVMELIVGEHGLRKRSSRSAGIANFEPPVRRGFSICNKDLAGTLTWFEPHVYCSQVSACLRLVRHCGASAPKVQIDQGPQSLRRYRRRTGRGHMGDFGAFLWMRRRRESLRRRRDDLRGGPNLVRGARHT
jgi:hypothetical protein